MYKQYLAKMPMGNPFRRSNNARLTSIARTNQNQGGGPKKAGLVPTAVMPAARWIAYNTRGLPLSGVRMAFTVNPRVRPTRPVGGKPQNYYGKFDTLV